MLTEWLQLQRDLIYWGSQIILREIQEILYENLVESILLEPKWNNSKYFYNWWIISVIFQAKTVKTATLQHLEDVTLVAET